MLPTQTLRSAEPIEIPYPSTDKNEVDEYPEYIEAPSDITIPKPISYAETINPNNDYPFKMTPRAILTSSSLIIWYVCIFAVNERLFVLSILASAPLVPFAYWWYQNKEHIPAYEVITCFSDGAGACVLSMIITYICMMFAKDSTDIDISSFSYDDIILAIFILVNCEELLKVESVRSNTTHVNVSINKRYMIVSSIVSVGFIFCHGLICCLVALRFEKEFSSSILLFVALSILSGTPLNFLCGFLQGLMVTANPQFGHYQHLTYTIPARLTYVGVELCLISSGNDKWAMSLFCAALSSASATMIVAQIFESYEELPPMSQKGYMGLIGYAEMQEEMQEMVEEMEV